MKKNEKLRKKNKKYKKPNPQKNRVFFCDLQVLAFFSILMFSHDLGGVI